MEENQTVEEESQQAEAVSEEAPSAVESPVKAEGVNLHMNGGPFVTDLGKEDVLKQWPAFRIGDTIKVHYRIQEGDKSRIQIYEGNVISMRGEGMGKSFVVRRISHEVGVERIFPYHSPSIAKIEVIRKGKVRRGKLFYLRGKSGKDARIKEAIVNTGKTAKKSAKKTVTKKATKKTSAAAKKGSGKKSASKKSSSRKR